MQSAPLSGDGPCPGTEPEQHTGLLEAEHTGLPEAEQARARLFMAACWHRWEALPGTAVGVSSFTYDVGIPCAQCPGSADAPQSLRAHAAPPGARQRRFKAAWSMSLSACLGRLSALCAPYWSAPRRPRPRAAPTLCAPQGGPRCGAGRHRPAASRAGAQRACDPGPARAWPACGQAPCLRRCSPSRRQRWPTP